MDGTVSIRLSRPAGQWGCGRVCVVARWFELPLKPWRLLHGGRAVLQGQVLAGRVIDLVAGEFLAEDDFLTARAGAAGTEALAGPVAVGAPLLAEVATLALTAGVDGAVAA